MLSQRSSASWIRSVTDSLLKSNSMFLMPAVSPSEVCARKRFRCTANGPDQGRRFCAVPCIRKLEGEPSYLGKSIEKFSVLVDELRDSWPAIVEDVGVIAVFFIQLEIFANLLNRVLLDILALVPVKHLSL